MDGEAVFVGGVLPAGQHTQSSGKLSARQGGLWAGVGASSCGIRSSGVHFSSCGGEEARGGRGGGRVVRSGHSEVIIRWPPLGEHVAQAGAVLGSSGYCLLSTSVCIIIPSLWVRR